MKHSKKPKPIEVGVISKLLRILETLQSPSMPSDLTLKQISQGASVNKATAYRFLTHLTREGYLIRTTAGAYRIGSKLERFGGTRPSERPVEAAPEPLPPGRPPA